MTAVKEKESYIPILGPARPPLKLSVTGLVERGRVEASAGAGSSAYTAVEISQKKNET